MGPMVKVLFDPPIGPLTSTAVPIVMSWRVRARARLVGVPATLIRTFTWDRQSPFPPPESVQVMVTVERPLPAVTRAPLPDIRETVPLAESTRNRVSPVTAAATLPKFMSLMVTV